MTYAVSVTIPKERLAENMKTAIAVVIEVEKE
jgi:hypothetical protein